MSSLFDPPSGRELAEKGIRESHEHAEEASPEWSAKAVEKFREYALLHEEFMTEDVRDWAYQDGFPHPPAEGAWGNVAQTAKKNGICHRIGTREAKSPGQHGKLMTLWCRGPEKINGPSRITIDDALATIDAWAKQMRNEGRLFVGVLEEAIQTVKKHLDQ